MRDTAVAKGDVPADEAAHIPFNVGTTTGRELSYIAEALSSGNLSGDGKFSRRCETWLETTLAVRKAMLVPSCTAALEMAALMLELQPGDEVVMPSYTFVSTANAFALRGAVPVFVDIRPDTLNIDETQIEGAITPRTKAIVAVHYAGEACEMDVLTAIADRHGIAVVEDAAQAMLSGYRGRALGTIGRFGCVSFHATKNVTTGHGGAFLVNDSRDVERAEILRDRGTDRSLFLRGDRQKYAWVDVGSSFFLSEICSAALYAQLQQAQAIRERRVAICATYRAGFAGLEAAGLIRLPLVQAASTGNGHIFFLLTRSAAERSQLLSFLRADGIDATFHYVPLHLSPAGRRLARVSGQLSVTEDAGERIVRLPLFSAMSDEQVATVVAAVCRFYAG